MRVNELDRDIVEQFDKPGISNRSRTIADWAFALPVAFECPSPSWWTTLADGSLPHNHHKPRLAGYERGGSE